MGPLVPSLLLSPIFLIFAWFFRATFVFGGIPLFSAALVIGALLLVFDYHRHYSKFAKKDPDRLQSEEYRFQKAQMHMIASKELPHPIPVDELPLQDPVSNLTERGSQSNEGQEPASSGTDEEKAS